MFGKVDEDYYKPIKTKSAFNCNDIEYESKGDKGDKDKSLSLEEYLDIIRPYLSDMINDHKTRRACSQCKSVLFLIKITKKLALWIPRVIIQKL